MDCTGVSNETGRVCTSAPLDIVFQEVTAGCLSVRMFLIPSVIKYLFFGGGSGVKAVRKVFFFVLFFVVIISFLIGGFFFLAGLFFLLFFVFILSMN